MALPWDFFMKWTTLGQKFEVKALPLGNFFVWSGPPGEKIEVKALPSPVGGVVNEKFEAHIISSICSEIMIHSNNNDHRNESGAWSS